MLHLSAEFFELPKHFSVESVALRLRHVDLLRERRNLLRNSVHYGLFVLGGFEISLRDGNVCGCVLFLRVALVVLMAADAERRACGGCQSEEMSTVRFAVL